MTILTAIILIFMGFVGGALVLSLCSVNRVHDLNAENDYLTARNRDMAECVRSLLYYINRFDKAPQYRLSLYFDRFPVTADFTVKEWEDFKKLRTDLSYLSVEKYPGKED